MNKYNSISKEELNNLVNNAMEDTKTELEKEIEELDNKKKELTKYVQKLKAIKKKKKELDELLNNINE